MKLQSLLKPIWALPLTGCLLCLFALYVVTAHQTRLHQGPEIVLDAEGYDPRELLLGHFVRINATQTTELADYDLSRLDAPTNNPRMPSTKKWALFERSSDGRHRLTDLQAAPFSDLPGDQIAIHVWGNTRQMRDADTYMLRVSLPIDRFYGQRRLTEGLEKRMQDPDKPPVGIILSVQPNGDVFLKGLDVDGTRFTADWW